MRKEPSSGLQNLQNHRLHFFWAGAAMHTKAVDTIRQWHVFLQRVNEQYGTEFEINIWVDEVGASPRAIEKMRRQFEGIATLRDITKEGISDPIIRYQIDQLRPNYGAASDVGRYRILKKSKALYLDTDVYPPRDPKQFMAIWEHKNVVLPDQFASQQGMQCSDVVLHNAPGDHPFIDYMVDQAALNYRTQSKQVALTRRSKNRYKLAASDAALTWQQAYLADTDEHRFQYTLRANANLLISDWLEIQYENTGGPALGIEDMKKRAGYEVVEEAALRAPLLETGSDLSWRGRAIISLDDPDEAINKALRSIQFEIEYKGVLRLDDHIMNVVESLAELGIPEDEIVKVMLEQVEGMLSEKDGALLAKINMAQLTFRFDAVEKFYEHFGLMPKTCLLETTGDRDNYDTKGILSRATQPFTEMHLLGEAEKLLNKEAPEGERRANAKQAERKKAAYEGKHRSAKLGFLEGVTAFYHRRCKSISIDRKLSDGALQIIEKTKQNLPVIMAELGKMAETATSEKEVAAIQDLGASCRSLFNWANGVTRYREDQERSYNVFGLFSSVPKPNLGDLTKRTDRQDQKGGPSSSTETIFH